MQVQMPMKSAIKDAIQFALVFALFVAIVLIVRALPAAEPQWLIYKPAGCVDGEGILQDVHSRCTPAHRQRASASDQVTYCHEMLHQVNSRMRENWWWNGNSSMDDGVYVNGLYCGGGLCVVLHEPRIRISIVRQYLAKRSTAYETAAQQWDDRPLYLLDEWVAYAAGFQFAKESGRDPHGSDGFMMAGFAYADAIVEAVNRHDPNYQDLETLVAFVEWHKQRCQELLK